MTEKGRQGVAIVGAGMVANTHLSALAELSESVRLVGVHSRTLAAAEAFADRATDLLGEDVRVFDGLDTAAMDPSVDWGLVLTPPDARREIVQALATAGKGVLLEKPVERTLQAATDIVEMCEAAHVPLGVVFQHRTREASRRLEALKKTGDLGRLAFVEAVVPWWREQSYYDEPGRGTYARDGGGVLISQAIHTLDLMMALAGQVREVQAMAATTELHAMEAEDFVVSGLCFAGGAVGSLVATTACYPGDAESLTFHFTKAVARLVSGVLQLNWRDGRSEVLGTLAGTGGGADPMAFTHEWHRDILADFRDAMAERRAPMVSGREALKVHALIEALVRSSREKCSVSVNYPEVFT